MRAQRGCGCGILRLEITAVKVKTIWSSLDICSWASSVAGRPGNQDQLRLVSETSAWDDWVAFFAEGVAAQAASATDKVSQLLAYQEETRSLARQRGLRGLAIDLVEGLIARPIITTGWVAPAHGVSRQAAITAVARLVEAGILRETTGRSYGRVFAADAVIRILER